MTLDEFLLVLRRAQKYKHKMNQVDPSTGVSYFRSGDEYVVSIGFIDSVTGAGYGHTYSFPVESFEPDEEDE